MGYQVFVVPALNRVEQASVWQLQTLAQAYGLTLKTARRSRYSVLSAADKAEIARSDAVVMIVTKPLSDWAKAELEAASKAHKPIYFLVEKALAKVLNGDRSGRLIVPFSRDEPIEDVAQKIHEVVQKGKASKEARTALGWLLGIGAGLFVLGALAEAED
jgi:hypothetical protein